MNDTPKPPRFRFRFGLRTLFVLLTLSAVFLGWNVHQVREREKLLRSISVRGAMFGSINSGQPQQPLPLVWSLLGATPVGFIEVPSGIFSEYDLHRLKTLFPEAKVENRPAVFDPVDTDF